MFAHSAAEVHVYETEYESEALLVGFCKALRPPYVLETGSFHGKTSAAIGRALTVGRLDTIEIDSYSVERAREATVGLPVTVHHCSSLDFIPPMEINLAFLDSAPDIRLQELEHFRPYLGAGAVVAIHDARDIWAEWPAFVGWRWLNIGTPKGLALLQRAI